MRVTSAFQSTHDNRMPIWNADLTGDLVRHSLGRHRVRYRRPQKIIDCGIEFKVQIVGVRDLRGDT